MTDAIPKVGEVLGHYRILECIGRGATGPVYRAWDEKLAREVALKTLWPQYVAEERVRQRFEREARAASRIDSPYVVTVYEIGESEGVPYLVMEFVPGGAVSSEGKGPPLDWRQAAEIARDVAEGLAAAHEKGIIHRDIKPANILRASDGRARIADFGLARAIAEESISLTASGSLLGTPAYLAPEVIEGKEATPLSDIYGLGILLYRLATGRLPFEATSSAAVLRGHLEGRFPKAATKENGIPESLDVVIRGCTARRPEDRYPSAEMVREDLERCLRGEKPFGSFAGEEAPADLPFWARWVPGAERSVIDIREAASRVRKEAEEADRRLREAEEVAENLAARAQEAESNASGWRSAAERHIEEGKEDAAREALGFALEHDKHAQAYREELERQKEALKTFRRAAEAARSEAEGTSVRGEILLARRGRARLVLGETVRRHPRLLFTAAAVPLGILLLFYAACSLFPVARSAPRSREVPDAFTDVTGNRFPPNTRAWQMAAGDLDGDGDQDLILYVMEENTAPKIYRNDGTGTFTPDPDTCFRNTPPTANMFYLVVLGDVDRDGDLDAFVLSQRAGSSTPQSDYLYMNDGSGRFTDVSSTNLPGIPTVGVSAVFFDADGDRDKDLFITQGASGPTYLGQDLLYMNDGRGRFSDVTTTNIPTDLDPSFGAAVGDIDNDGDSDILVTRRDMMNKALINNGEGIFTDQSAARLPGAATHSHQYSFLVDVDKDGDLDFTEGTVGQFNPYFEQDRLYLNDGTGVFTDVTAAKMPNVLTNNSGGPSAVGDLDGDGYPEVYFTNSNAPGALLSGSADGTMTYMTDAILPGHETDRRGSAVFFDFDGDGDLDVIIGRFDYLPVRLYENPGGSRLSSGAGD